MNSSKTFITTSRSIFLIFLPLYLFGTAVSAKTLLAKPKTNEKINITCLPESSLQIDGDSSVKKFSAKAHPFLLSGTAEMNQPSHKTLLPWTPTEINLVVDVENLKSNDRTLDKHMHEAMKEKQYPTIRMKLTKFTFAATELTAAGTLTVAGATQPIELRSSIRIENNNVTVKGNKLVLMTDFGIKPPTLMLGTLKTKNEINVTYDVTCTAATQLGESK